MPMIINILIFLSGLLIYAGYGITGFIYLLSAVSFTYIAGLLIPKYRWVMWISTAANGIMLALLKLQPVTGWTMLAPLGVSYFTLQIISYNVDVYRGKYKPERNFFRYSLYVTYLPHLFIGPIERYDKMKSSLFNNRHITFGGISSGIVRILWGLFKKLVIASRAGVIVSSVSAEPAQFYGSYALLAMLLYSVQLYADFSGGIDAVIGISEIFGIRLSENFDVPYFSQSFQEFWRRWHITLGAWLRDYVYIPLGGSRKGSIRKILNTIIVFLVSGLWHGVNYLLWGLINGVFVSFGDKLKTRFKTLNRIVTFMLICLLWSFFIWSDLPDVFRSIYSVFTVFNCNVLITDIGTLGLNAGEWIVLIAAIIILWLHDIYRKRTAAVFHRSSPAVKTAVIGTLTLLVLVFGMYGIGFNTEEFIYSRF